MKKLAALFVVLVSGFAFVACGGEEEITPDNLASAMDEVCSDAQADFDAMGTRGITNPQLALEFEGTAEVRQGIVDEFNDLNLNEEAQAAIEPYVTASEEIIATDKAIAKAAAEDDTQAVNAAFTEQNQAFTERDAAAKELGVEVCAQPVDIETSESGTAPPEDLETAELKNTIEEASDGYLAAFQKTDCVAINRNRHTDAGEMEFPQCELASQNLKGGNVAGTESYGVAGVAEVVGGDGTHYPTFFIQDFDGNLRYAGDSIHDSGGLRPAPEDNDSQDSVDAALAAIRDNDAEAFNETLPDESSGFWLEKPGEFETFSEGNYNEAFVKDVRGSDAEPVQLGLNAAFGFYLLDGTENNWVLTTIHTPGTGANYRFSGYWPVPKP